MSHLDVECRRSGKGAFPPDYSPHSRGNPGRTDDAVTLAGAPGALCSLTERDARLLEEAVAINGGMDTPIGRAVAEKLTHAELRGVVPDDHVKLDSHVTFRVDGRAPLSRVLVHWDKFRIPGLHLSLHTPWGMTPLGMKAGHEAAVCWHNGVAEMIKVESVAHSSQTAPARLGKANAKAGQPVRTASPQDRSSALTLPALPKGRPPPARRA